MADSAIFEITPRVEAYLDVREGVGFSSLDATEQQRVEGVINDFRKQLVLQRTRAQAQLDARPNNSGRATQLESLITDATTLIDRADAALAL